MSKYPLEQDPAWLAFLRIYKEYPDVVMWRDGSGQRVTARYIANAPEDVQRAYLTDVHEFVISHIARFAREEDERNEKT